MLLGSTSLETLGVKACAATRVTTGLATFTTTHGVIDRVHYNTTVVRTATEPTAAAGLTTLFEGVVGIAYDTYSGLACQKHFASFAGR